MGQFSIDQNTDVSKTFTELWSNVLAQDEDLIRDLFIGVDVCRNALLSIFESEEEFLNAPSHLQNGLLYAVNKALEAAVKERELHIANGISFFILWVVAVIKKDNDAKVLIEKNFSETRSRYDI